MTNQTREIRITIDGDGYGPGSTYADAESYRGFLERRLHELYPAHDISISLAREGQTASRTVEVDETEYGDVDNVLTGLWEEFCADTTLWPSTQVAAGAIPDAEIFDDDTTRIVVHAQAAMQPSEYKNGG